MQMRTVNGYLCRNCADEELAKRGVDPAHPRQAGSGGDVYVSPADAARNSAHPSNVGPSQKSVALGINKPHASGERGTKLNLYA